MKVAFRVFDWRAGAIDVEDDFLGHAVNRKVSHDFHFSASRGLDTFGFECERGVLGHIKEIGLRKSLSRFSTRVSTELASMVASIVVFAGSEGSY